MSRVADPTAKIALLSAAEAVFSEKGLDAAKVEDITRRAGLSKGAFYLHFASKEEALRHICESFLARCASAFKAPSELADIPREPGELLAFWLDIDVNIFDLLWQNRATVGILQGCQGSHHYLLQAFEQNVRATSERWIEFWQAQALFRPELDPGLTSELFFGAYNRLALKMLESPKRPPFERWLAGAQSLFVRGLGTPVLVAALEGRARTPLHVHDNGAPPQKRRVR
jgi:AcrR family transcriptional regulator